VGEQTSRSYNNTWPNHVPFRVICHSWARTCYVQSIHQIWVLHLHLSRFMKLWKVMQNVQNGGALGHSRSLEIAQFYRAHTISNCLPLWAGPYILHRFCDVVGFSSGNDDSKIITENMRTACSLFEVILYSSLFTIMVEQNSSTIKIYKKEERHLI